MRKTLCSHNLTLSLRMKMVRCYVFPELLYGMESWTITDSLLKRLEAFEMWVYRRLLKISWVEKVRNTEVLARMNKQLKVILTIKRRKLEYFGHIMKHHKKYELLHLIMEGKMNSRRGPGRRRTSCLKNLRQWYGKSSVELFRAAVNKTMIVNMIANLTANDR